MKVIDKDEKVLYEGEQKHRNRLSRELSASGGKQTGAGILIKR